MAANVGDPSSLSNVAEFKCKHINWTIDVDFPSKILRCSASLEMECLKAETQSLVSACGVP